MVKKLLAFIFIGVLFSTLVHAQDGVYGKWKTIDDNSDEAKSIIEIYEADGQMEGRVVKLFLEATVDQDPLCSKCDAEDVRFNKKIIGMRILKDMKKDGEEYVGGTILDPESGRVYNCRLWLEGDTLKVRGYWGPFYRTQTWTKAP